MCKVAVRVLRVLNAIIMGDLTRFRNKTCLQRGTYIVQFKSPNSLLMDHRAHAFELCTSSVVDYGKYILKKIVFQESMSVLRLLAQKVIRN